MEVLFRIFLVLVAYIAGSIPSSVWVGRFFYGVDVREHGSGNAGATNTFRVLGVKAGIPVLLMDIFKGFGAVKLIYLTPYYIPSEGDFVNFQLLLGIAAVLGHIFPVFVKFKGGKGVATLLGVVLAIHPYSALISMAIFVVSLIFTKYVSLSSMIAGFSFPILVIIIFKTTTVSLCIFSLIIAILLLFTHQKNIERLIKREENKANLFKNLKKESNR
ncbi:MAG TPA: acyl-phosphate glycerol 3-phosphate acyltransferase [Bacteroidales bacterium]|nr:MAG: acyl-phosphate glycerol 3-phosphate acyltransferase [Bacteroidetes bacterium GWF2_33_38]OFY76509.1 MAG: acyl-phosphate glycerol 3-phosphate acyltransferase [Bacteroidetes bacterium RIFOXYA12_FULL_33_9]OFY87043.1 MAG: acyl-phosphate glycerol 3-phosphate acyltransferase [Bacteroidetes bacterium RIFOXYA2_FULL_33_7]HBF89260.1 acyl-phosphate glycerol 3-phosphate acyltransferase [Bacteroidales bacterium]